MKITLDLIDLKQRLQALLVDMARANPKKETSQHILAHVWEVSAVQAVLTLAMRTQDDDMVDLVCMWLNANHSLQCVEAYNRRNRGNEL